MKCELPGCHACGGRTLPMHLVRSGPYETYCNKCAEFCPVCIGTGKDCTACESSAGIRLTHYGRVELERKEAERVHAFLDMARDTMEER